MRDLKAANDDSTEGGVRAIPGGLQPPQSPGSPAPRVDAAGTVKKECTFVAQDVGNHAQDTTQTVQDHHGEFPFPCGPHP